MWDWTKNRRQSPSSSTAPRQPTSLLRAYEDLRRRHKPLETRWQDGENIPHPEEIQALLQQKIAEYRLKDITLRLRDYTPQTWPEMERSFEEYIKARAVFLKRLAYEETEACLSLGLDNMAIHQLKQGYAPENFNTHLKIPFDFGGSLEPDNFSLVKTHPVHARLHHLFDLQIESGFLKNRYLIYIPWFEGKIYHD